MPKQRYTPPNDEVAGEIAQLVDLYRQRDELDVRCRELLARLADRENGRAVPIAHLADQLKVERKTIYRHLGRTMT